MQGYIKQITHQEAVDFLLPKHYSGRIPSISRAYGWFLDNNELVAVVTYGKPASNALCEGVCGKENKDKVYELNRLCRVDWFIAEQLSQFVAYTLRDITKNDGWIIVSYSDTAMAHHGYVYQACNFLYTGITKQRTDKYTEGNKHSRHYDKEALEVYRKVRSAKHRYVYFAMRGRQKKEMMRQLKYQILPYPKGDNQRYELGNYLKPEIIKVGS